MIPQLPDIVHEPDTDSHSHTRPDLESINMLAHEV